MSGQARMLVGIVVAGTLAMAGCGPDRLTVYPVRGQVLIDGQPAKNAYVVLHPQGGAEDLRKLRPYGRADAEGRFELTTFQNGDGAPAGQYKVTIVCPSPAPGMDPNNPDPEMAMMGPDRLQGRYQDPQTSTVSVNITAGTNQLEPFRVR